MTTTTHSDPPDSAPPTITDSDNGGFDPRTQDHFETVDDELCPHSLTVTIDGTPVELRCEVGGDHDEHETTLRWQTTDDED